MKNILTFCFILFFGAASAQKISYNDGLVTLGPDVLFKVQISGGILMKSFKFSTPDDQEVAFFKYRQVETPVYNTTTGTYDNLVYYDIYFDNTECSCQIGQKEMGLAMLSEGKAIRKLANELVAAQLVVDGQINPTNVTKFCTRTGKPYAAEIERLENRYQTKIIIID